MTNEQKERIQTLIRKGMMPDDATAAVMTADIGSEAAQHIMHELNYILEHPRVLEAIAIRLIRMGLTSEQATFIVDRITESRDTPFDEVEVELLMAACRKDRQGDTL